MKSFKHLSNRKSSFIPALTLLAFGGCAGTQNEQPEFLPLPAHQATQEKAETEPPLIQTTSAVQPQKKQQKPSGLEETAPKLQPGVGREFIEPPPVPKTPPSLSAIEEGETGPTEQPLTLEALEALACEENPTLVQAKAQVDGAFGKAIQAGLWPNPTVGYLQEQISVADTPGEFLGGFVEQEIVTADKLDLSRSKFLEQTNIAEWMAMAQEYRVLNDIRVHFFRTLGRQKLVEIQQELLKNAEDNLVTVREMYNYGQATRAEVHQANALLQEQRLQLLMVQNDYREAFETLTALVGVDLPVAPLEGDLEGELTPVEWDLALVRILEESPEVQAAYAKLRSDQITLKREKVEPVPNLFVRGAAGHNYEARQSVGSLELFAEVPLYDWNQGTVKQAEADLVRQQSEVQRTKLRLRRQLAQTYRRYLTALQHVQNYQDVLLPEARKAYETLLDSYEADRVEWPTVLDAQRGYYLRRKQYVQNLIAWREAEVLIAGYLLHGGLEAPMDVAPPSHIDAVPKPR